MSMFGLESVLFVECSIFLCEIFRSGILKVVMVLLFLL